MSCEIHPYYKKSFETLDDMAKLMGSHSLPLISQMSYYLTEMKLQEEALANEAKLEGIVLDFVLKSLRELLDCFLEKKQNIKELSVMGRGEDYSIQTWNKIFENLPGLLHIINGLVFNSEVTLILEDNGVRLMGRLDPNQNITTHRRKCYSVLREMLKRKVLLTFKIIDDEDPKLDLFLNVSYTDHLIYECLINPRDNLRIGFPNIVEQYLIGPYEASLLPNHLCLEITEDFGIKKYHQIPKRFIQVLGDFQIIHFSFLFRPVSIIIPFRGELKTITLMKKAGDTGRGEASISRQPSNFLGERKCYTIDLFELISN